MMASRPVLGFSSVFFLLLAVSEVKGAISTGDTISLDCGSQQTFTCSVTGSVAAWTITGLRNITAVGNIGQLADTSNVRITTNDTNGVSPSSTITITGFTEADDGGRVRCVDLGNLSADEGMTTVSVGLPACPTMTRSTRNTDFTAANITWSQPTTYTVTSTTVTYCPTSSPNCGNSVTCTSPCTISGLDPCVNYSGTVTPTNNCGSATGCTMNMVDSLSQEIPGTPVDFRVEVEPGCTIAMAKWAPSGPATSTNISYCPSSSSPTDCSRRVSCSSDGPCTISGLIRDQEYNFTAIHINSCGNSFQSSLTQQAPLRSPPCIPCVSAPVTSRCLDSYINVQINTDIEYETVATSLISRSGSTIFQGNMTDIKYVIQDVPHTDCDLMLSPINTCGSASDCPPCFVSRYDPFVGCVCGIVIPIIIVILLLVVVGVVIGIVIYRKFKGKGGSKRSNSTEPMKPRPGEEYADPQKVRESKESGKQGITYAALEFSEQAGSTGGQNVRSNKGEAVQYMAVEHA